MTVVGHGSAADVASSIRFVNDNVYIASLIVIVSSASEYPVSASTRSIRKSRTEIQPRQHVGSTADTRTLTGCTMSVAIIGCGRAVDRAARVSFIDHNARITALIVIVGPASEHPMRCSAWNVRERRTET